MREEPGNISLAAKLKRVSQAAPSRCWMCMREMLPWLQGSIAGGSALPQCWTCCEATQNICSRQQMPGAEGGSVQFVSRIILNYIRTASSGSEQVCCTAGGKRGADDTAKEGKGWKMLLHWEI